MCETFHKGCTAIAKKLCAETGMCPLGGGASDNTVVRLPANQRQTGKTPKDLGVFSIIKRRSPRTMGTGKADGGFMRSNDFISSEEAKEE